MEQIDFDVLSLNDVSEIKSLFDASGRLVELSKRLTKEAELINSYIRHIQNYADKKLSDMENSSKLI